MTPASRQALEGLRDLTTLKWYVIPLLACIFYIYTLEMKKARATGNWNVVFAGLTVFGMDFINETWNGWVLVFTGRSAFWTAPGETALRTMVGWNIEIMFMFAISGIIYANTISEDRNEKILGIPNWWFWAIGYSGFCVFVEVLLNMGGHLVWEYPFWHRTFKGVWLIFLFGYLHFYVAALLVIGMRTYRAKVITVASLYGIAIVANIFGIGVMGWTY
ncbi:hypothetical protein DSCA_32160 [Desulfosarcina alkanivorans]|uniref:Carotenoid biosynthesis protein n=1 Tax=Desulfosarcina alkanivorans TaxID=571177 RepID=A0A5K7YJC0_9BACT|nr:hypothetical protein [Desulfosarcina alkanivorans]BBO69286.1 hypothetical protein DSCA_32160 [Desulfosarcina alkanivorans]